MTAPLPPLDPHTEGIELLFRDRRLAHKVLFEHRHKFSTPDFHGDLIDDLHSDEPAVCDITFRDAAKSTLAEEAVCLRACFREFKHFMLVGVTLPKGQERLHSVRRQFEKNERLRTVFGDLVGQPWGDDKIELTTGVTIQAVGRQQAIRGTKNEDTRPDFILCDDIDDPESVRTPEAREKIQQWFYSELLPAGDGANLKVRMLSNDMGVDCLANKLDRPGSGFRVRRVPWEHLDPVTGERRATWPSRFPLEYIDKTQARFYSGGRAAEYNREYLCKSEAPEGKAFKQEMFRLEPRPRTWQAVYAMFDPARTINASSATTGYASWSWINSKLVVWKSWGKLLLPNEIVDAVFHVNDEFHPVEIGVEKDGLEEWLMQPIRQESVKRGIMLPTRGLRAPKGKMDFIRGLQPCFKAREVEFAEDMPDLKAQLLSFPSGKIDVPNALAYALLMRPGAPMYEDFNVTNIVEDMVPSKGHPLWLVLNATPAVVTAALVQLFDGVLRVYADWIREGDPATVLADLVREVGIEAGRGFRALTPQLQFDRYNNCGLVQAANKIPIDIRAGADLDRGRSEVRALLQKQVRGFPALLVSSNARWTLNGFSGGYCRALLKQGGLADHAEEGVYRVLMEGIESFAGQMGMGVVDNDADRNYRTRSDGSRYVSALRAR